jgi:hypothetical protein
LSQRDKIHRPKILLDIGALSYRDYGYRPAQFDAEGKRRWSVESIEDDIHDVRWSRSYLAINSIDKIKESQCISWFRCRQHKRLSQKATKGSRSFDPASIARLVTKMPQLERMDWGLRDDERWSRFVDATQQ